MPYFPFHRFKNFKALHFIFMWDRNKFYVCAFCCFFCLVLFAFATNSSHKHAMLYTVYFIHTNKMAVKTITFRFQLVCRKGFRIHLKMENTSCVLHAIAFKNIHLIFERFIRMKQPCKMVKMIFPFCAFVLLCAHILYPHFSYWFVCLRARARACLIKGWVSVNNLVNKRPS